MPGAWCCVPFCHNEGGHRFPKDTALRKRWIKAINRGDWLPSNHSIVCYKHFKDTDYISSTKNGYAPLRRKLRKGSVPSIFEGTEHPFAFKEKCNKTLLSSGGSKSAALQNRPPAAHNLAHGPTQPNIKLEGGFGNFDVGEEVSPSLCQVTKSSTTDLDRSEESDDISSNCSRPPDASPSLESGDAEQEGCPELKFFQSLVPQLKKLPPLALLKLKSRFVTYLIQELQDNAIME